jgi:hypothetical protein
MRPNKDYDAPPAARDSVVSTQLELARKIQDLRAQIKALRLLWEGDPNAECNAQ